MATEFRGLFLIKETPKAIQVEQRIRNERIQQWIPKSVITYRKNYSDGQDIDLQVEDWFIEKDDCKLII